MKKFKILSKKLIVDAEYCQIEKQRVLTHKDKEVDWFVCKNPDAVVVVPFFETGEVLIQKTYKHGAQVFIAEFPAGMIDKGESPSHAAARELREETGLIAKKIEMIGSVLADPTGSIMRYHFFVAKNCRAIAECEFDEGEQIETFLVKNFKTAEDYLLSTMQPKKLQKKEPQKRLQVSASTIAIIPFVKRFIKKSKQKNS